MAAETYHSTVILVMAAKTYHSTWAQLCWSWWPSRSILTHSMQQSPSWEP